MGKLTRYHLTPGADGWRLVRAGSKRAVKAFEKKAAALKYARRYVKERGGSLRIHKADGTIQEERTYPRSADGPGRG